MKYEIKDSKLNSRGWRLLVDLQDMDGVTAIFETVDTSGKRATYRATFNVKNQWTLTFEPWDFIETETKELYEHLTALQCEVIDNIEDRQGRLRIMGTDQWREMTDILKEIEK